MKDFFAPSIPADVLQSPELRVVPVIGDSMHPTFRGDHDYALIRPVSGYVGEGIYVLECGFGIELFRVESTLGGSRQLRLSRDNPAYLDQFRSIEQFESHVLGIVVADIKVRNCQLLAAA
ncbi:hypothetical protein C5748_18205 [Phyllobacterium phragmitis]|uniref:Peptidase S24/S26A/S26B/S26C domain-containing protein n=1 Tax=Phyllobacterium phragmitis TaxID=2670329 RepID=A0A2S9INJ4_9HYPH|nr:S24/S26 family peptidase [Phyllobacterium phragmitis]PRD42088.1 hypothetical protein C5748_18205 [Phyllobacterium phragmitis]